MPDDPNDVVRHVILRVLVDADNLGSQMGKARAQLKALEDSEKQANQRRQKSFENVTRSLQRHNEALKGNQVATERAAEVSVKAAKETADSHERSAKAVKEETAALNAQGREGDRQAAATQKREQDLLKAQQSRRASEAAAQDAAAKRAHSFAVQELKDELALDALSKKIDTDQANREKDAAKRREDEARKTQATLDNAFNLTLARAEKLRAEAKKTEDQAAAIRSKANAEVRTKRVESAAGVDRRDRTTDASIARLDATAEANRIEARRKADAQIERAGAESATRIVAKQKESNDKRANLQRVADAQFIREARKTADELLKSKALTPDVIDTTLAVNANRRAATTSQAGTAAQREAAATAAAQNAQDKNLADSSKRRADSLRAQQTHAQKLNNLAAQQVILEQRALDISERRGRAEEAAAAKRVKNQSLFRTVLQSGIQAPLRAALDADPDTRVSRRRQITTSFDDEYASSRESGRGRAVSAARGVGAAFNPANLSKGVGEAASLWDRLTDRIKAAYKELRSEGSGGGGGLSKTLQGISGMADGVIKALGPLSRSVLSFRGLIVALITALGPLVAMMGAVGAAAMGLASNFVALAGSLLALPGLIGAAVAGFGALAVVMGPLQNAFKAFGSAQKAASDGLASSGKAAKDAANALVDAQRAVQDAERAHQRAIEDAPRAERRLSDARKQAARDIQDYRLALQKLAHDQEGAALGVESAEQAYRKALADPTANNLDRKIARHDVVGAMFEQRDQQVSGGRLIEDANEAERRGVEGSDAVIDAKRGIEDANRALEDSTIKLTRAYEDLTEAEKDNAAGGAAIRKANDELEAALGKLGPKTRKVVEAMLDLSDSFKEMQKRISEKMFGPLSEDTEKFADVLKSLESFLTPAAEALGDLAHEAITLFTNPEWKKFFSEQGEESGYIIGQLGKAALAAADGFRAITEVARPFTRFVVDGILGMAKAFDEFATSEDGRKKIGDFLELSKQRMQELWPVVKDIASGFAGFFKALNTPFKDDNGKVADFTTRINEGLGDMAKTFKDLGDKASDPNGGFMKWLEDVGPLIKDLVGFLGELGDSFATMASDPDNLKEASAILETLTDEILPELVKIFDKISESGAVSKILGAFGSALKALSDFLDNGGTTTLTLFFGVLEKIGQTIEFLTDTIPGFATALGVLSTAIAALVTGALFVKIFQLDKIWKGLMFVKNSASGGGGVTGVADAVRDKVTGRAPGTTASRRDEDGKLRPGTIRGGDLPDSPRAPTAVLASMARIEGELRTLIGVMRACCAAGGPGGKGTRPGVVGKDGTSPHTPPYGRDVDRPTGVKGDAPPYGRETRTSMPDLTREGTSYGDLGQYGTETPRRERTSRRRAPRVRGRGIAGVVGGILGGVGLDLGLSSLFGGGGAKDQDYDDYDQDIDPTQLVDPSMAADPRRVRTVGPAPEAAKPVRPTAGRPSGLRNIIKGGAKLGKFGRVGGALARGATGGLPGVAASLALAFGGDAAINKFVKDDEDAASMSRGLGAVSTGAGIGGLVGSIVPGVGTAIGAGVGGAIGGAYSLVKDPNLRDFVGDKISTGTSKAVSSVKSVFTGEDAEGKPVSTGDRVKAAATAVAGPAALLANTDVGKTIGDGLKSAGKAVTDFLENTGSGIGKFFTETIPTFIEDNLVAPVSEFFTETLPGLPSKAFHAFNVGFGKLIGFLIYDIPRGAKKLFTETLPDLGKDAWKAIQKNLFDPMVEFITETIPNFFTETIPQWFDTAGQFLQEDIMDPIYNFITGIPAFFTETIPMWFDSLGETLQTKVFDPIKNFILGIPTFFTETIPAWFASLPEWFATHVKDPMVNFFTVTLPDTFKAIPGWLYDHLAKPIGEFFSGLAGHVGDFLSGSWDWVKGVFSSATSDVSKGIKSREHPGTSMSGGLIEGIYSGIEDNKRMLLTPGEFVVRRGVVEQPGSKAFLREFNEGRVTPAQFYAGLAAQATPKVMSVMPPPAALSAGLLNSTVDNSRSADFSVRDITINNPVREKSDRSMRRALQIAAIRHRR